MTARIAVPAEIWKVVGPKLATDQDFNHQMVEKTLDDAGIEEWGYVRPGPLPNFITHFRYFVLTITKGDGEPVEAVTDILGWSAEEQGELR